MEQHFWDEQYKRDGIISSIDFQTIYRATDIKDNGNLVTIKEYLIKKNEDSNNQKATELYKREIKLINDLQKSNCENFVHIINSKEDIYEEREENYYYIIREYCMGNLEDFVTMNNGELEPGLIQIFMNQLNNAFKILKDKNIIHRNIKPSNILFCYKEDNNFTIKLSGLNYYKQGNDCPQINNNSYFPNPPDDDINEKYDLWSIGAIMYFMYFGDYQNIGNKTNAIKDKDLKDLIEKCLKNKNNRISWNDYFNHSFFKKYYKDYNDNDTEEINIDDIALLNDKKNKLKEFTNSINQCYVDLNKINRDNKDEKIKQIKKDYDEKIKKLFTPIDNLLKDIQLLLPKFQKNS